MLQLTAGTEAQPNNAEPASAELPVAEPGCLLSRARQNRNLGLDELADALLLRLDQLYALEENRLDHFPSLRHAAACLRIYADRLGLDGSTLAAALEPRLHEAGLLPEVGEVERLISRPGGVALASALTLAIATIGGPALWLTFEHFSGQANLQELSVAVLEPEAQAPAADPTPDKNVALQPPADIMHEQVASSNLAKAPWIEAEALPIDQDLTVSNVVPAFGRVKVKGVAAYEPTGLTGADRVTLGLITSSRAGSRRQNASIEQPSSAVAHDPLGSAIALPKGVQRTPDLIAGEGSRPEPWIAAASSATFGQTRPTPKIVVAARSEAPRLFASNRALKVGVGSSVKETGNAHNADQHPPATSLSFTKAHQPTAEPAPAKALHGSGRYAIQLAAVRGRLAAIAAWHNLAGRYPSLTSLVPRAPESVEIPGRGIFHRVRAGTFESRADAQAVCSKLRVEGADCLVVQL